MAIGGHRAVLLFLIQRDDATLMTIAGDIDWTYMKALEDATKRGVEVLCFGSKIDTGAIELAQPVPIDLIHRESARGQP